MSTASRRHLARVSALPCCTCGAQPVEVHHARTGEAAGMAQRPSDWLSIPLCPSCHRGEMGVHGDRTMLRITKKTELALVGETLETLYGANQK